jgi:hypothetical protein
MRHISKKTFFRGAGKSKPKPKPALLKPPQIGAFKVASSYAVAEIIDLISDGPIEGLVDQSGASLRQDIFKGIYLDNTPIQNTQQSNQTTPVGKIDITAPLNRFASIWISNGKLKQLSRNKGTLSSILVTMYALRSENSPNYFWLANWFEHIPNFPTLRDNRGALPDFYNLSGSSYVLFSYVDNKRLLYSYTYYEYEKKFKNLASSSNNSITKTIAEDNLKRLNLFKQRILLHGSIPQPPPYANSGDYQSGGFTLQRENIFHSYFLIRFDGVMVNELKNVSPSEKIYYNIDGLDEQRGLDVDFFLEPEVLDNGNYSGKVTGLAIFSIPMYVTINGSTSKTGDLFDINFKIDPNFLFAFNKSDLSISIRKGENFLLKENELFNFTNVSAEFKKGEEFQTSLVGFDKIINDYFYESKLFGPFDLNKRIQRITPVNKSAIFEKGVAGLTFENSDAATNTLSVSNSSVLNEQEGSVDIRSEDATRIFSQASSNKNYSEWNSGNDTRNLEPVSITHTVENPLVEEISVSISIGGLSDTIHVDLAELKGIEGGKLGAGSKIPTTVIIQIETGKIKDGQKLEKKSYNYLIAGLIEGGCIIDFGGDYLDPNDSIKETVKILKSDGDQFEDYLNKPFPLPLLSNNEDPTITKRYVKVTKLSAETNSILINKDLSLLKVSEIIGQKLSYPFSSVAAMKLDARSFNSIPERSYDCRLKKVKIPSNYSPLRSSGKDKRYIEKASTYVATEPVYIGDWDGEFQEGWTDNPAWILYDLLTSQRYGLGSHIDESQINKWELYKIARFCDAVDDLGFFVGVSDGVGGLEPRFSCNIILKEATKVYDAINVVANLFRGIVFFGNSEINFLDDRPRVPIAMFNNSNIKNGLFNYNNTQRDMQFNTVEVVYLDRFDNYKTKVEYVVDEQDIRKRGVFKTTMNTTGVTSRAMARRIGQHIIYQTIKENQGITFQTGLEALLCRPGDLIVIEDEMKTRASNFGRVLSVDRQAKTVRIDNSYISGDYAGTVTLYAPTGYSTSEDLSGIAAKYRGRVNEFSITGNFMNNASFSILTGLYRFSGYTSGITNGSLDADGARIYPEEMPLYTGKSNSHTQPLFCYYNTGATGFVFSTGRAFQNNTLYDKLITNTGVFYGVDIDDSFAAQSGNFTGFTYSTGANKRTSPSGQISGAVLWNSTLNPLTDGILDDEINTYNISQIAKMSITGFDNLDYGSLIYLNPSDPNTNLLPIVKQGSIYRLERKLASDQLYKIVSIREDSQNEYSIVASKYNTGKYEEIEKFVTEDFLPKTFNSSTNVNNVDIRELDAPIFAEFGANQQMNGKFNLTGRWISTGNGVTGYRVSTSNSLAGVFINQITTPTQTGILITGQTDIGNWTLAVTALGNNSTRINSLTSTTGTFIAYSGSSTTTIGKPVITKFSLD